MPRTPRPSHHYEQQKEVGQRVLWARELVEPNQAAFAKALGVDRSTITKIEKGDRAPTIFLLREIARRLRVTTDFLIAGSLQGVDWEMAAMLAARHPELAPQAPSQAARDSACSRPHGGTSLRPKKPARA